MPISVAPPVGQGSTVVSIWSEEGRAASTYEGTVFPVGAHVHPIIQITGLTEDLATRATKTGVETLTNKTLTGPLINPVGSGLVGLTVQGLATQTGNLFEVKDSAGVVLTSLSAGGSLASKSPLFTASSVAAVGVTVQGVLGQTANLLEFKDSAGLVLTRVSGTIGGIYTGPGSSFGDNVQVGVITNATTAIGVLIRGRASQTADLFVVQNNVGTSLAYITADGTYVFGNSALRVGANAIANGNDVQFGASAATQRPLVVRGAAGQTANLAEFQNSAGGLLVSIRSDGLLQAASGLRADPVSIGEVGIDIVGRFGQTANLQTWRNSGGTVLASVGASGDFFITTVAGANKQVQVGAVDSAGAGFRTLRVVN